jgi:radical SAM protein with 4Fe4S-binding SPASM domain
LHGIADQHVKNLYTNTCIDFDLVKKLVDEIKIYEKKPTFFLIGGEPLLHNDFIRIIKYIKAQIPDSFIDTNTNGTLLNKCSDELIDSGIDAVYISLDGSNSEINNAIRGSNNFEKVTKNIINLVQKRNQNNSPMQIAINYTISKYNYSDLIEMILFSEKLKIDELILNLPVYFNEEDGHQAEKVFNSCLNSNFISWKGFLISSLMENIKEKELYYSFQKVINYPKSAMRILLTPTNYTADDMSKYFTIEWIKLNSKLKCNKLNFRTTILPDGNITPCTIFPDLIVGNIYKNKLSEIWTNDKYSRIRNKINENITDVCFRCCDAFDETNENPYLFVDNTRNDLFNN